MGLRGVVLMFCARLLKLRTRLLYSQCHPSTDDLPEDVMFNILSRLEVKTIINCKCVCKKWRNLVLDSHFVHLHIQRSPDECLLIYHYKFIDSPTHSGTWKLLEIENKVDHDHLLRSPFMSIETKNRFKESHIISTVGSVHGLICLWELGDKVDNTWIFNPITKEYKILPKQQFDVNTYWDIVYGFGVSATGEYKVIRFWSRKEMSKIEVYALGTDKWRVLDPVPYYPLGRDQGLFLNNHVHWIVQHKQLFSFNLDGETFQVYPLPPPLGSWIEHRFLGVLKGSLCLFSSSGIESGIIWVMKEHGIKKSWHKELAIQEGVIPYPKWGPLSLVDCLNGRSILFFVDDIEDEDHHQLMAYCPETSTIEETTISDNLFTVISYRPSFLKTPEFPQR